MTTLDTPPLPAEPNPDEVLRRLAGTHLAAHLDAGVGLAARCTELASAKRRDPLGPINAAARLFNANARVAQALATVAQVERRQRTIFERIQPPKADPTELNSIKRETMTPEEARRQLRGSILQIVDRIRAEDEPSNPHAEAHAQAVKDYEQEFGRAR